MVAENISVYTPLMSKQLSLNHNTQGILCLMGAVVFLNFSDAIIKWLSPHYPLHEITLFRACFALVIVSVFVFMEGGIRSLKTRRPLLHLTRGFSLVLANMFFFLGLATMPLAQVVALFYTAPLFICLLAKPVLGESVGLIRWTAIGIGMLGVLIIVQPQSLTFSWLSLLPIGAALMYAAMQMMTRKLGMQDTAGTMTFYMQIAFILVSIVSGFLLGHGQFDQPDSPTLSFLLRRWHWPIPSHLILMATCGAILAFGAYLLSQAYRLGQATVVAPFEYTSLPFAILTGYFVWRDVPGLNDLFGSLLIIFSGIAVVWYERKNAQKAILTNST